MELWIRSQNKKRLFKVEDIYTQKVGVEYLLFDQNKYCVGAYKNEERCLEIIDEIQKILQYDGILLVKDIDISGMKKEDFEQFKPICYTSDNPKGEISFNQLSSYVYEMPQE